MNKLKPAFKFFFTLLRLNKLIVGNIIFSVFGISMFVLSGFNIGEIGSENYLVDIIWVVFGYWMILEMLILSLSATFQTKAVQSMPYIEAIYKKVLPLIAFSVNIIIAAINITSMLIALNSGEIVLQAISDRLVILAFLSFITYVCLGMCTKPGGAIVFMTPFVLVPNFIILLPKDLLPIFTEGFNIPITTSIVIYVVTLIGSLPLSFFIADKAYSKRAAPKASAGLQNI